jgi:hypothetical protein
MMKACTFLVAMVIAGALATAATAARLPPTTEEEWQAVAIAEKFIATQYPLFRIGRRTLVVDTLPDQWEVTYLLPKGMLGGSPHVFIDKRTFEVVRFFHDQ